MLSALVAAVATAAAPPAQLPGIWEGTVGDLPVRACFVGREWGAFGAYYYHSRLRLIPLQAEEGAEATFREGGGADGDGPRWRIDQADSARLSGEWTSGSRRLPVRLRRIASVGEEESACSSIAFHQARLAGATTTAQPASLDGVGYRRLTLSTAERFEVSIETFALDRDDEAARRINAELSESLAGDPPQWFQCIQDSLVQSAFEGSFAESLTPVMITPRWLSVAHHWDGFCGGAHPSSSNNYRTFDLTTGAEVDLHDWLNAGAVKRERFEGSEDESVTLQPAFRDFILERWRSEGEECDEVVRTADYWNIGLRRDALVFQPLLPHVSQACGDEFPMPFDRLRPFLTEQGARHLAAIAAAPAAPR